MWTNNQLAAQRRTCEELLRRVLEIANETTSVPECLHGVDQIPHPFYHGLLTNAELKYKKLCTNPNSAEVHNDVRFERRSGNSKLLEYSSWNACSRVSEATVLIAPATSHAICALAACSYNNNALPLE